MEKDEDEFWRCAKHPSPPRSGVCPVCLRDRLLRLLCPDCSSLRPCSCASSAASTSSSASTSSLAVGSRVADLIDSEPAFRRSRSVTFQVLKPSADGKRWKGLWPFRKVKDEARLTKSRSIGVVIGDGKVKGWNWLPSPMKALRGRKAADVVQARSPLCRG